MSAAAQLSAQEATHQMLLDSVSYPECAEAPDLADWAFWSAAALRHQAVCTDLQLAHHQLRAAGVDHRDGRVTAVQERLEAHRRLGREAEHRASEARAIWEVGS